MKRKIAIEFFSALSFEVKVQRTETTGLNSPPGPYPRPNLTPGGIEGFNVHPGGPTEVERLARPAGVRQGTAQLRGACAGKFPAMLESTLLEQRLASGRTQPAPAPPADIPSPRDSAGGPSEVETP